MKIEYIKLVEGMYATNRAKLAVGVAGVKCTYAGGYIHSENWMVIPRVYDGHLETLTTLIPRDSCFGSLEVYANDRANLFVRRDGKPIGFLRFVP